MDIILCLCRGSYVGVDHSLTSDESIVVMDPGKNFLTRVGSGQPFMVWVSIWKIAH